MTRLFMMTVCCIALTGRALSQQVSEKLENDRIVYWIDSTMKTNNIPSLSLGIVRQGVLSFTKGFGTVERGSAIKVDEHTLYQIGSDTKKFTAIIVNNLVAEGKLSLKEPITTYLVNQLTDSAKLKLSGITLEMLLRHTAGIPNREPSNKRKDGDPMTIEFSEDSMIRDLNVMKLDFAPNSNFAYSNFGFAIAGYISEKVTGLSYDHLVKKYVTDKYGMPNTGVYLDTEQEKRIAWPYRKDNRMIKSKPWTMGKMTPAGGIYSNVTDVSRQMIAQIKVYRNFDENKQKSHPLVLTDDKKEGHFGFGLAKVVDSIGVRYGHGGDLDGYASGYVFAPDENIGIILLTSSGGRWLARLEKQILAEMMNNRKR
jgi:CubicO group peptidase (beta-lactamase class C family)